MAESGGETISLNLGPPPLRPTEVKMKVDETTQGAVTQRAIRTFKEGDVAGSLALFDEAEALGPEGMLRPYIWHRGVVLYHLGRYKEASEQFQIIAVPGSRVKYVDMEEVIWDVICLTMAGNEEGKTAFPPEGHLTLKEGKGLGRDRPDTILPTILSLFLDEGVTEDDLLDAGLNTKYNIDKFHAYFYLGMYFEIRNDPEKAKKYMKLAATSEHATAGMGRFDFFSACSKVHCKQRGWD